MKIEWWMIDGILALTVLAAAIRGAAKGIGDTVLRIAGYAGSVVLSYFYSSRIAQYLASTKLSTVLHDNIFRILRGSEAGQAAPVPEASDPSVTIGELLTGGVTGGESDPFTEALPKALGGLASDLADRTMDAAAVRLTNVALSIIAIVLIMLAVWLVMSVLRLIVKSARKNSFIIGVFDRIVGLFLGALRGLLLCFVIVALLIPVTTMVAPLKVPEMLDALHQTYAASVIYDVNPVMLLVKYILG